MLELTKNHGYDKLSYFHRNAARDFDEIINKSIKFLAEDQLNSSVICSNPNMSYYERSK